MKRSYYRRKAVHTIDENGREAGANEITQIAYQAGNHALSAKKRTVDFERQKQQAASQLKQTEQQK